MKFQTYLSQLYLNARDEKGSNLADLLEVTETHVDEILDGIEKLNSVEMDCRNRLEPPWDEICLNHIHVLIQFFNDDFVAAYAEQAVLSQNFLRAFTSFGRWSLPVLFVIINDLRTLAMRADEQLIQQGKRPGRLEDAARTINKAFTACITDRSPNMYSRKWGTYYVIGLLFKTYFKLKSQNLCKNILRAVKAADLPPLEAFPRSHVVTYRYFLGVLYFLEEEYAKAETELEIAFKKCHKGESRNKERILHYLIPASLLRGRFPSASLLSTYPSLSKIFTPFIKSIRTGDVRGFDQALWAAERPLIQKGTYLTVERSRIVVMRMLFKKVFLLQDRNSRFPIQLFQQSLSFVGMDTDIDEVECLLATMIYKGYIKGYLSHEKKFLVLSKEDPFPSFSNVKIM